jgi:hypothetical protein
LGSGKSGFKPPARTSGIDLAFPRTDRAEIFFSEVDTSLTWNLSKFRQIKILKKKKKSFTIRKVGVTKNVNSPAIFVGFGSEWSHSIEN